MSVRAFVYVFPKGLRNVNSSACVSSVGEYRVLTCLYKTALVNIIEVVHIEIIADTRYIHRHLNAWVYISEYHAVTGRMLTKNMCPYPSSLINPIGPPQDAGYVDGYSSPSVGIGQFHV